MAAQRRDITLDRGAPYVETFTLYTDSTRASPRNLTTFTAARMVIIPISGTTPAATLILGDGITLGGVAGTITITISDARTTGLTEGTYLYDLWISAPDEYIIEGLLFVRTRQS